MGLKESRSDAISLVESDANRISLLPFWEITRPFTLLPPFLGIVSGSCAALGSQAAAGVLDLKTGFLLYWPYVFLGGLMALVLNAASNVLNQVTEVEVDRRNKPCRVLPTGRLSVFIALVYAIVLYCIALGMAWCIEPVDGIHHTFWCALAAAVFTVLYSVKPAYLKSRGWWANITIAVPRGCLLKVAGWGCIAPVTKAEPWFIGLVFMLFLLGAASSKDFSDVDGDRAFGIETLVVRYGPERASALITPFFLLPWVLLVVGRLVSSFTSLQLLRTNLWATVCLGGVLVCYGAYTAFLMDQAPVNTTEGNHVAWKHMYLMMMAAQIGLVACYFI